MASGDEHLKVTSMVRACLLTSKGSVPLGNLSRDFVTLVGSPIPFRKLGFNNLEGFLRSIPDVVRVREGSGGQLVVEYVPDESTKHISKLVSSQRQDRKKSSRRAPTRSGYYRRPAPSSWTPPPPSSSSFSRVTSGPSRSHNSVRRNVSSFTQHAEPTTVPKFSRSVSQPSVERNDSSGYRNAPSGYRNADVPPRFQRQSSIVESKPKSVSPPPPLPSHLIEEAAATPPAALRRPLSITINNLASETASQVPPRTVVVQTQSSPPLPPSPVIHSPQPVLPPIPSPVSAPVIPPVNNKLVKDPIVLLAELAARHKLGDVTYSIHQLGKKLKVEGYFGKVKVGDAHFTMYPETALTEELARWKIATEALEALRGQYERPTRFPVTEDSRLYIQRVSQLLQDHTKGLLASAVPKEYETAHKETLPNDWFTHVEKSKLIKLDRIADNREILVPLQVPLIPLTEEPVIVPEHLDLVSPDISPEQGQLDSLPFPDLEVFNIFVSSVSDDLVVSFRLVDDASVETFHDLYNGIDLHYMNDTGELVSNPSEGSLYIAKVNNEWLRVLVLSRPFGEEVSCWLVDHGDDDTVLVSDLRTIKPEFASVPCQVLRCKLAGLEDWEEDPPLASYVTELAVGRSLVCQVMSKESNIPSVILYDTSTDKDISINDMLIKVSKDSLPQLPEVGKLKEVYVSYVAENGDVFVQIQSDSFSELTSEVEKISEKFGNQDLTDASQKVEPSRLVMARYALDSSWYRATVTSEADASSTVEVFFVDFGNTELISLSDLRPLSYSDTLSQIPHQAIRCRLNNIPPANDLVITEKTISRMKELLPPDLPVVLRTVAASNGLIAPAVEIFRRVKPDDLLASVNMTLSFELDLFAKRTAGDTNNNRMSQSLVKEGFKARSVSLPTASGLIPLNGNAKLQNGNLSSSSDSLASGDNSFEGPPLLTLPKKGEFFDVHVALAANPGHFIVQPLLELSNLKNLLTKMQDHYSQQESAPPETVKEGMIYAGLHIDEVWYRVRVTGFVHSKQVTCYFVDYGDLCLLSTLNLRPLDKIFHHLPCQAVRAELADIVPKSGDWSALDCIRFQRLTVDKDFVSKVVKVHPKNAEVQMPILSVELIDTNSESNDVYVTQLLVKEGRAISKSSIEIV